MLQFLISSIIRSHLEKNITGLTYIIFYHIKHQRTVQYNLEEFMDEETISGGIGFVKAEDRTFIKTSLAPNFKIRSLTLGLDLNLYIPTDEDDSIPDSLDFVVFRKIGTTIRKKLGFEWGRLTNLRYGYGLIMDDYDSGSGGGTEFNQGKTGFNGYAKIKGIKFQGLVTYLNTAALRVEVPVADIKLFGAPLTLGATYVEDSDGVSDNVTTAYRDSQTAFGLDIGLPISDTFTLFSEYAQLENHGDGFSTGFLGKAGIFDYRGEFRILQAGFVPGYFNNTYEATSFDFDTDSLTEDTSGFLFAAKTEQMNGNVLAGLQYELYDDVNRLTAAVGWKNISPVTGVINYAKEFNVGDDSLGTAIMDFYYDTGKWYDIIGQYKWVFLADGTTEETYSFGIKLIPQELMPSFL